MGFSADGLGRPESSSLARGRGGRDLLGGVSIIAKRTRVEVWESGHGDAEQPLKAWHDLAKPACWNEPAAINAKFATASLLTTNRVVFTISGNKYRLVVKVKYGLKTIFIRLIGTHADDDKIDASTI